MHRILVVEDEALIRKSLIQSIDWAGLQLELAAEAENGARALQLLDETHIDIVLTDMRMPVCDGSQLLRELEARRLDCEIIVLSEYSDFAYMQQAIHAHVFDYLLKPIDPRQINALLASVTARLEEKRQLQTKTDDPLSALYRAALHLLPGEQTTAVFHRFKSKAFFVCCLQTKKKCDCRQLQQLLPEQDDDVPMHSSVFPYGAGETQFCILSVLPAPVRSQHRQRYNAWLEQLTQKLKFVTEVRVGVGTLARPAEQLDCAISEATTTLQFIHTGYCVLCYEQIRELLLVQENFHMDEDKLTALLAKGTDSHYELYKIVYGAIVKSGYLHLPAAKRILIDFTLSLERCCQKAGCAIDISAQLRCNYIDCINAISWEQEAEDFLQATLGVVFEQIALQRSLGTREILDRILRTVKTQYMHELSLMDFSQKYHLNYIYLSRRFKDLTGKTFTDYLMDVRMQKARQLIEHDGLSEKTAAALVGYTNPYYFSSSYRKYFSSEKGHEKNET